MKAKSWKTKAD